MVGSHSSTARKAITTFNRPSLTDKVNPVSPRTARLKAGWAYTPKSERVLSTSAHSEEVRKPRFLSNSLRAEDFEF